MPFTASSRAEVRKCQALVKRTERLIKRLKRQGKTVHIVWDVDHVLVSGRSDDAFVCLSYDVKKYFTYEERLLTQGLEEGPWTRLAADCGDLHASQDVVTARSSYLALRAIFFLVSKRLPIRWQLFVGHQSKAESYRIILTSFLKDPNAHVLCVDDAKKHVDAFDKVAEELGMKERCLGILSPQLRDYDEAELRRELDLVMRDGLTLPFIAEVRPNSPERMGRYVQVTPDTDKTLEQMFQGSSLRAHMDAMVERHRATLEELAEKSFPGKPKTVDLLYLIWDLMRQP